MEWNHSRNNDNDDNNSNSISSRRTFNEWLGRTRKKTRKSYATYAGNCEYTTCKHIHAYARLEHTQTSSDIPCNVKLWSYSGKPVGRARCSYLSCSLKIDWWFKCRRRAIWLPAVAFAAAAAAAGSIIAQISKTPNKAIRMATTEIRNRLGLHGWPIFRWIGLFTELTRLLVPNVPLVLKLIFWWFCGLCFSICRRSANETKDGNREIHWSSKWPEKSARKKNHREKKLNHGFAPTFSLGCNAFNKPAFVVATQTERFQTFAPFVFFFVASAYSLWLALHLRCPMLPAIPTPPAVRSQEKMAFGAKFLAHI